MTASLIIASSGLLAPTGTGGGNTYLTAGVDIDMAIETVDLDMQVSADFEAGDADALDTSKAIDLTTKEGIDL